MVENGETYSGIEKGETEEIQLASKNDVLELKKDISAVLEATKELVKLFGELKVFTEKWSKAGKF